MSVLAGGAIALPLERTGHALTAPTNHMASSALPLPFTVPFGMPSVLAPVRSGIDSRTKVMTDYYRITMRPFIADVLPGFKTTMWGYNGEVPGPTVKATRGRPTVVRHINSLPAVHPVLKYTPWTSVHLHGSPSLPQYDGYASDITNPGQYKDYVYPNTQPGRTLWYHDHGVHHTAENISMGLEGQYHLIDPAEQSLPLPRGDYDIPLTVMDTMFNADGSLLVTTHDDSGMFGDVILVNGRPWPVMTVKKRKYRFRILNGSVSRSYKWSLDSGDPMTVIATDGGLVPFPQPVLSFRHGMGERYDVVIDFAKYKTGQRIVLRNSSPKNNQNYANTDKVMAFDVVDDAFDPTNNSIPAALNPTNPVMNLVAAQSVITRPSHLERGHGLWQIDGGTWDDVVRSNFTFIAANPNSGDAEIWEIHNDHGGWFHPAHIHLVDFQIISRNGRPPMAHERGPKDVAYIGENEVVQVLMRFEGRGKYMIHCHNLVHEDHDMMTQYEVFDPKVAAQDPLGTPAKWLPETAL
jgi:FtsP/CotA-like multicopper oxidase with cupredoxin domain